MKKLILLFPNLVFFVCISLFLFSCLSNANPDANYNDKSQTENGSSGNYDDLINLHQIQYSENKNYKVVLSTKSAVFDEIIYIKIETTNDKVSISEVFANNIKCKEIENNYYNYYFNMPNENVYINITISNKIIENEIKENKISWDKNNKTLITKSLNSTDPTFKFYLKYPIVISSIQDQVSIISSNQNCISIGAIYDISINFTENGLACGGKFKINLNNLNEGKSNLIVKILMKNTTNLILYSEEMELQINIEDVIGNENEIEIKFNFKSSFEFPVFVDVYSLNDSNDYFNYEINKNNDTIKINTKLNNIYKIDIYYFYGNITSMLNIENITNDFYSITNNQIIIYQNNIIISLDVYNEK